MKPDNITVIETMDVADLILAIEAELRILDIWDKQQPAPAALQSTTPFCYDTLYLHQWLQWIFIPGIKNLLENNAALPANCAIAPLAEEVFPKQIQGDCTHLLHLLQRFDVVCHSK
ncbi:YqcC family protein [Candidatus Venteria ishoeyi]|uniref:YqcC-like domain-containing protein n=1 Tax=Candidatus Venteria ishoeyi TaxID=1899563 RepID=A0A1H6F516_9GAMM|nr:YqcC family protein [Candidatus Venteria ishoeyi]MDM8545439.1 YqcC family protein [Candidatus Venteria ishoeyi]SEH04653.1 Uncharacterised protein [Candidatus Venteria ishoeyi]